MADLLSVVEYDVDTVINWLKGEGQREFSIDVHYAPYPTEVNDRRIDIAAEVLSDLVDLRPFDYIPDCDPVTRPFMDAVLLEIAARKAARTAAAAAARAKSEREKADRERAHADQALAARRTAIRSRRRATLLRLLDPTTNASPAEVAMARKELEVSNG